MKLNHFFLALRKSKKKLILKSACKKKNKKTYARHLNRNNTSSGASFLVKIDTGSRHYTLPNFQYQFRVSTYSAIKSRLRLKMFKYTGILIYCLEFLSVLKYIYIKGKKNINPSQSKKLLWFKHRVLQPCHIPFPP